MSEESGSGDSNGRSSPTQSDPQTGGPPVASPESSQSNKQQAYIKQLLAEKQMLEEKMGTSGGVDLQLTHKLLLNELERLQSGGKPQHGSGRAPVEERRFADIIKEKPIKVSIRVLVPVKEHPKFNFVGKLLGPKGNSLKRLQEDTMTKMAILGRGSMRDKHKEEELRASTDPKYAHFSDDLHVEITAFAPPAEAHARIAYALAEVRKFLVPDYNDEIRQEQMREMQLLNTSLLGLASPGGTEVVGTSPVAQSPNTSPPPTSGASATLLQAATKSVGGSTAAGHQNGRHIQAVQNGRPGSYVYNQQLLLHPAFRGLTARAHGLQLPGAASVYHAGAGSILGRLRHQQHQHNIAAAAAAARISPGAGVVPSVKHQRNSILSILAGGPRSIIGGGALDGSGSEQLLTSMSAEDMMVAADEDGGPTATVAAPGPNTVYGLYENYAAAAAAAAASGTGYGLIEGYANGNGVLTAESMEDLAVSQDAVNGSAVAAAVELAGRSEAAGAVKMDRSRYRHDPYGRYTPAGPSGVKLPL